MTTRAESNVSIAAFVTTCPICGESVRCVVTVTTEDNVLLASGLLTIASDHSPLCAGRDSEDSGVAEPDAGDDQPDE